MAEEESKELGYKNSYEILSTLLSFHVAYDNAKNDDGKVDVKDLAHLIAPLSKLPAAISDAKVAIDEFKDLDQAEKGNLMAALATEYDIADDKLEIKVEEGIALIIQLGKFLGTL